MGSTKVIGDKFTPDSCKHPGKEMPDPLDHDAWWLIQKRLEADGIPADEVERGINLYKSCGARGMTVAEILTLCNESEDCEGSNAWRAKQERERRNDLIEGVDLPTLEELDILASELDTDVEELRELSLFDEFSVLEKRWDVTPQRLAEIAEMYRLVTEAEGRGVAVERGGNAKVT